MKKATLFLLFFVLFFVGLDLSAQPMPQYPAPYTYAKPYQGTGTIFNVALPRASFKEKSGKVYMISFGPIWNYQQMGLNPAMLEGKVATVKGFFSPRFPNTIRVTTLIINGKTYTFPVGPMGPGMGPRGRGGYGRGGYGGYGRGGYGRY